MKLFLLVLLITAILSLTTLYLFAQDDEQPVKQKSMAWVPRNGYWVIESKLNQPKHAIVHFYNNDNIEVYTEEINGIALNVQKRKCRKQLKRMLDKAINAWALKQPLFQNKNLVIAEVRK